MAGFIRIESTDNAWPLLAGFGILAILLGALLLFFPLQSLRLMLSLFGILSIVIGLILLWAGICGTGFGDHLVRRLS